MKRTVAVGLWVSSAAAIAALIAGIALSSAGVAPAAAQDDPTDTPPDRGIDIGTLDAVEIWDTGVSVAGIAVDPQTGDTLLVSDDGKLTRIGPTGQVVGSTDLFDWLRIQRLFADGFESGDASHWSWGVSNSGSIIGQYADGELVFADVRGGGAVRDGQSWVFAFSDPNLPHLRSEDLFSDVPHPISMWFFLPEADDEVLVGFADGNSRLHVARLSPDGTVIDHWYVPELDSDSSSMVVASVQMAREAANRVAVGPDGSVVLAGMNADGQLVVAHLLKGIADGTSNTIMFTQPVSACNGADGCGQMVVINHEEQFVIGRRGPDGSVDVLQLVAGGLVHAFNIGMPPTLKEPDRSLLHIVFDAGDGITIICGDNMARVRPDGSIQRYFAEDFGGRGVMVLPGLGRGSLTVASEDGRISTFDLR